MNTIQRLILLLIALGALIMLLYPPFYMQYPNGVINNLGYHYLFDPPYRNGITAFVHAPTLLVQFLGLLIVGGSVWFLSGTSGSHRKNSIPPRTESKGPTLMGRKVRFDPSRAADPDIDAEPLPRGNVVRTTKRIGVTVVAFLASGILIAIWMEYFPVNSLFGALMAAAAVGLILGAWRWSASLK